MNRALEDQQRTMHWRLSAVLMLWGVVAALGWGGIYYHNALSGWMWHVPLKNAEWHENHDYNQDDYREMFYPWRPDDPNMHPLLRLFHHSMNAGFREFKLREISGIYEMPEVPIYEMPRYLALLDPVITSDEKMTEQDWKHWATFLAETEAEHIQIRHSDAQHMTQIKGVKKWWLNVRSQDDLDWSALAHADVEELRINIDRDGATTSNRLKLGLSPSMSEVSVSVRGGDTQLELVTHHPVRLREFHLSDIRLESMKDFQLQGALTAHRLVLADVHFSAEILEELKEMSDKIKPDQPGSFLLYLGDLTLMRVNEEAWPVIIPLLKKSSYIGRFSFYGISKLEGPLLEEVMSLEVSTLELFVEEIDLSEWRKWVLSEMNLKIINLSSPQVLDLSELKPELFNSPGFTGGLVFTNVMVKAEELSRLMGYEGNRQFKFISDDWQKDLVPEGFLLGHLYLGAEALSYYYHGRH